MIHRWPAILVAACGGLVAWRIPGSVAGGVAWLIACAIAAAGAGIGIERITQQRMSTAITVSTGLAALLSASLVLSRLGLLDAPVMLALLAVSVALNALPRQPVEPTSAMASRPGRWFALWVTGLGALLVMVMSVAAPGPVTHDGWNQVFVIKRLWDLGELGAGAHASGIHIIGKAYAAWFTGAEFGSMFAAGLCPALVMFVVASELSVRDRRDANLLLVLVVIAIAVKPTTHMEWLATLFQLSAILALRTVTPGRTAWHTLISAVGLGLIRDEYWLLAVPYVLAAVVLPRCRALPRTRILLAVWLIMSIACLLVLGVRPGPAILRAIPLLAAWPFAALMLRLLGTVGWRSCFGPMCLAMATYQLGIATYAIAPSVHVAEATFGTGLAVALVVMMSSDLISWRRDDSHIRIGTASVAFALFAALTLVYPSVRGSDAGRVLSRFTSAIIVRGRYAAGIERRAVDIRAAQLAAPAGARIAFWGRSAALLDFERNAIRDIWSEFGEFVPVTDPTLRNIEWLIIDDIAMLGYYDPWMRKRALGSPTEHVSYRIALESSIGGAQLYRVYPEPLGPM